MAILSFMPDYLFFIIIGILLIILYRFMPDDIKDGIKKITINYGVYIIILLFWLYFRTKWGYVYENPEKWPGNWMYATFIASFALLLFQSAKWLMYEQRYFTRAVVANNLSGSCNRYQEIGDWIVLFVGTTGSSTEKLVLPFPIPQKLIVVPKVACDYIGEHIVVKSQVFLRSVFDLPEDVCHFIETDTFARLAINNIYFGLWDEELRTSNPDAKEIESNLVKLNKRVNELTKMLDGKLGTVKGFVSDTMATVDKFKGKSYIRSYPQQQGGEEV